MTEAAVMGGILARPLPCQETAVFAKEQYLHRFLRMMKLLLPSHPNVTPVTSFCGEEHA